MSAELSNTKMDSMDLEEVRVNDEELNNSHSGSSDDLQPVEPKDDEEEKPPSGFAAKWSETIAGKLHAPIVACLQRLTQVCAHNPKRTLSTIGFFSIAILVVGLMTNFTVDVDEDKLWTPANSRPIQHMDWIDNDSGFPTATQDLILFFHENGHNVLGQSQVSRVFDVLNTVRGVSGYEAMCAESTYMDAATNQTTCEIDGIVNFWNLSSTVFETQVSSDAEAIAALSQRIFPDGTPVAQNSVFGKPQRDNDTDLLTSVLAYTVVVKFPGDTSASEKFEDRVLDVLLDLRDAWAAEPGNTLRLELTADGSFSDEFERAIVKDIPLIPIVFIIMSVFTAIVFFKRDKVQSRSLLGFGAVVAVLLSLLSSFGLLFTIGVPFTSMTQILPFVIFGIGLDDAFIIFGSYSRTNVESEITERIRHTIDDVGMSITLTSITSTLAFGLGCLSSIPAVYWLCLYAFPTVIFIYLYQLTFFVAWIVLDERRIQHNKRDCCICITAKTEHADKEDEEEAQVTPKDDSVEAEESAAANTPPAAASENKIDAFMVRFAEFLLKPWVKVAVILSFIFLAVMCSISASKLTQEFNFTDVMPDDSYVTDFFDAFDEYTVRNAISPFAYFRSVDQSNDEIQQQMESYVSDLVAMDAVVEEPEFFWLRDFNAFVAEGELGGLTFNQQVETFLADPVYFDLYNDHIVRDSTGSVTASRVQLNFDNVDVEDVNEQIDTLEEQRSIARRQAVNQGQKDWKFFSYDSIYNIWEFFSVSVEELIFTTIMGVVAVTGVALVFVPHWTAALFTLPMICLLYVDLLGVMQWAGVHINAVSYISLVMSIGLLVDFIMHVLLRYYECTGNRRERTVEMLRTMGSSILIGGISTFLGTLPLAFSTSTIFFTIFIAFVGLVTLGIGHGLILLPVILSMIGPEDEIARTPTPSDKEMTTTVRTTAS